jgi:exopolysaccharide biosynthesis polyprenyl glycosylphosphotransferase
VSEAITRPNGAEGFTGGEAASNGGLGPDGFGVTGRTGAVAPDGDDAPNGIAGVALEAAAPTLSGIRAGGARSAGNGVRAAGHGAGINDGDAVALDGAPSVAASGQLVAPTAQESLIGRTVPPSRDAIFRRLLAVGDLLAALGGLTTIALLTGRGIAAVSLASVPVIVVLAKIFGRYDHDHMVLRKSTLDEIPALLGLAATYALVWSMVAFLGGIHMEWRGAGVVALWASTAALLIIAHGSARALGQLLTPQERALIVGSSMAGTMLARSLACDPGAHVEVVGFLTLEDEQRDEPDWATDGRHEDILGDLEGLVRELKVERVFLIPTSSDSDTLLEAVTRSAAMGVNLSIVPRLFEVVGSAVEFDSVGGVTVLGVRRPGLSRSSRALKRAMDIVGASIGLIALAPLSLLVALAIKLDSAGPVFFRQARVGRGGRQFRMIKFRSMFEGAEAQRAALDSLNESDGIFKLSADPRATRVGRLLRRTSLDEVPQLINVLRGEMSLVGPRPLIADEDVLIEGRHRDRLRLSPGMTGPWQVLGPSRPPLAEMVKVDYLYAANWSLWNDIKILMRTMAHIVAQRGV